MQEVNVRISKEQKEKWIKELDEMLNEMREQRPLTPNQYDKM